MGLLLVLILATPSWGQVPGGIDEMPADPPGATITDMSAKEPMVNKIKGAANVVPTGGAVIQSVTMKFVNAAGTAFDAGAAVKDVNTSIWRRGSIQLPSGTYKVHTTVTLRDPLNPAGNPLPVNMSGEIVLP
jgi:hypothetical protein